MNIVKVTIPAGETASAAVPLNDNVLVALIIPDIFTGSTVTFKVSVDGVRLFDMKDLDDGSVAYSIKVAEGVYIPTIYYVWAGVNWIQVVSNATETDARVIQLITRTTLN